MGGCEPWYWELRVVWVGVSRGPAGEGRKAPGRLMLSVEWKNSGFRSLAHGACIQALAFHSVSLWKQFSTFHLLWQQDISWWLMSTPGREQSSQVPVRDCLESRKSGSLPVPHRLNLACVEKRMSGWRFKKKKKRPTQNSKLQSRIKQNLLGNRSSYQVHTLKIASPRDLWPPTDCSASEPGLKFIFS